MKHTTSHEEPHRVIHEVIRPIIQEVHEIIQPYRRVVQQVQPVIEEVRTVIAKDSGKVASAEPGLRAGGGDGGLGRHDKMISDANNGGYGMMHGESKQMLHKLPPRSSSFVPIAPPSNIITRSKVFFTKRGIPVYQSSYMGPALSRSY